MSEVYLVHPPLPAELVDIEEARKQWVRKNATGVIKLRKPQPWRQTFELSKQQIRRDLALQDIFQQCADQFFFLEGTQQTKLIEVVKYDD